MLALTATQNGQLVTLSEQPDPVALPSEAIVEPKALSLNRGEVKALELGLVAPGTVVGWDVAGVVRTPAADGSGPPAGARVVGLVTTGAWAQQVAVPTSQLAALPEAVSFEQAATLPIAALTALYAVRAGGYAVGKRTLVLGASGGVGRFAVQLAKLGGAHVTAVSSSTERARGLEQLGADEILPELVPEGPSFDVILDGVGGHSTGAAMQRVAPDGIVVAFASSDDRDVSFPASSFRNRLGARVLALQIFHQMAREHGCTADLERLLALLAARRLVAPIDITGSWRQPSEVLAALLERRVVGKAVLTVD